MRILAMFFLLSTIAGCARKEEAGEQNAVVDLRSDSLFINEGNRLIALTFDTLRKSLLSAIDTLGVDGAISFCSEQAYPLTDMHAYGNTTIRRTSLRYRNPQNKPDSLEVFTLMEMEAQTGEAEVPKVKVVRDSLSHEIHFFKPIMMQAMCLNCHGTPGKEVSNATRAAIKKIYRKDAAVNFKEGDLRGMWHVVFNRREE